MREFKRLAAISAMLALIAVPALADTLVLKSGEHITGYFEGGSARVVKFRPSNGTVKDYDILTVQEIRFGEEQTSASPLTKPGLEKDMNRPSTATSAAPATGSSSLGSTSGSASSAPSADPRLVPGSERVTRPTSSNAANTGFTIPTGAKVVIRMIDSINSEQNKLGETFVATLEEPIMLQGIEVVPKNADVRGRITNINEAGRVAGSAELGLELTQIIVNGIPYSVTTSEYQEVGESRGGETAKRAGGGAALGAIIGAIAGGGKGAVVGAGVGAGGATAIQVLTKGEKLNIPSETKLEFTLRAPLVIAAK